MIFEDDYQFALSPEEIATYWNNLQANINFSFTSKKTWDYNCVMWSLHKDDDWKDFGYDENGELNKDQTVKPYVAFFEENGFELCDTGDFVEGFEKICIYSKDGNFSHVCRQIAGDMWASKMGDYEDIEHTTLEALIGKGYGNPQIFMAKTI